MAASDLVAAWLARADELAPYAAPAAEAFRRAAGELKEALRSEANEIVTLDEAATLSGYSADHLRHLVSDGRIPNAGKKNAPRIRRGDIPRKASKTAAPYNPQADAINLESRRFRRAHGTHHV